ncbi:MAG TPA: phosphoribosylformylglycinamidine synthase [Clostridiaceae bacterium]|nr:phosphoribosylformylglycinamidine synthase [Clostridiaceae bacterium]
MIVFKKFPEFDQEANALFAEIKDFLQVKINDLKIYHIYQFADESKRQDLLTAIFDLRYGELIDVLPADLIFIKDKSGQYNQVEDLTLKYVENILGQTNDLRYYKGYKFELDNPADLALIKQYLINSVVEKETNPTEINFDYEISDETEHLPVDNFLNFSQEELEAFKSERGVGLDVDDLQVIQNFFRKENRDPRFCEIKMLDTYWSDHCRHTTFLTNIENIEIMAGAYHDLVKKSYLNYLNTREFVYAGRKSKPVSLMDLATINAKELKRRGILNDMEESDEINACSVEIDLDVNGKTERWLHLFKNETHNHPTEIEPYGGAHTCIGGAIRDPLSGRGEVIQGIRIVGAGNPLTPFAETPANKLPQKYICNKAMNGFSDYANQIGSPVGLIREYYDDGYVAKRMELGALVGAVKKENVLRESGEPGDIILLLGAATGRDGLGAAIGSSAIQTAKTLEKAGAEVQRGNPFAERKIMRLFKRPEVSKLIKKCNDFGAGGVSVAIGELSDGLDINLNKVYTKYPGLNGYEIALAESQERMAVIVSPENLVKFIQYCEEEDVRCAEVARVTDTRRLRMFWHDEIIMDLSRELLDSNGAMKYQDAVLDTSFESFGFDLEVQTDEEQQILSLNKSIFRNLTTNFDSTLGRNKVLAEYGGKNQLTVQDGIVTKFPVEHTKTASVMTYGFYPGIAKASAYHAGYYAVLQSIVKNIALTGKYKDIRISMQEFFPAIHNDPKRMGTPFLALLGAFEVMSQLEIPAIGGKDSMSGSYQDIDVPPTIVSFAVNTASIDQVVSREFKQADSKILLTRVGLNEQGVIDFVSFARVMSAYNELYRAGKILAASAISEYGLTFTLQDMGLGNSLGVELDEDFADFADSFIPGNLIVEVADDVEFDQELFYDIGITTANFDYAKLIDQRTADLAKVYPDILQKTDKVDHEVKSILNLTFNQKTIEPIKALKKKVLIPVFEGATGEYDLARAMKKAGFEVEQAVIRTLNKADYYVSLQDFIKKIARTSVLAIPHGDYMASTIKNISGALTSVLEQEKVKTALQELQSRDGLLIGIGAGMSALIDAGYFGQIKDELFFTANKNNQYVHLMQDVTVIQNSYLTDQSQTVYTAPISGRNITLYCADLENIQTAVDILAINQSNLLPGDCGIDAIASKNGKVIGIRSLIDRMSPDLFRNISIADYPKHFEILTDNWSEN